VVVSGAPALCATGSGDKLAASVVDATPGVETAEAGALTADGSAAESEGDAEAELGELSSA